MLLVTSCSVTLLFREHADLQVQVRPLFGATHLVFLVHQHECGEEDELDSDDQGEERKRIRIEPWNPSDHPAVHGHPSGDEQELDKDEAEASEKPGDGAAHVLGCGSLREHLLLKLGDGRYVPLSRGGHGWLR
jgi:hypothetical protein